MTEFRNALAATSSFGRWNEGSQQGVRPRYLPMFAPPEDGDGEPSPKPEVVDPIIEDPAIGGAAAAALALRDKDKPSDNEVKLLREVMDNKKRLKDAEAALKAFDGIDPQAIRALLATQKTAEEEALRKAGDFETLKQRMATEHDREKGELSVKLTESQTAIALAMKQITELTIGADFANSKFISTETVLTPNKARRIYEDHFEIEDGRTVGYDTPRGSKNRVQIVNGRGDPLSFDEAMKRIIDVDPDKDSLLRSTAKSGSGENSQIVRKAGEEKVVTEVFGAERLARILAERSAAKSK